MDRADLNLTRIAKATGRSHEAIRKILCNGDLPSAELLQRLAATLKRNGAHTPLLEEAWVREKSRASRFAAFFTLVSRPAQEAAVILEGIRMAEEDPKKRALLGAAIDKLEIYRRKVRVNAKDERTDKARPPMGKGSGDATRAAEAGEVPTGNHGRPSPGLSGSVEGGLGRPPKGDLATG